MLQILKDTTIEDKNRDLFIKSLIRECERQDVEYIILTPPCEYNYMKPLVITDPYTYLKPFQYNNADLDTTANVVFDIIKDLPSSNTLLIGRGNVGRVIANLIIDGSNHTLSVANSKTTQEYLEKLVKDADIIINTSTAPIHTTISVCDKIIIDINNNFDFLTDKRDVKLYDMKHIGKLTVQQIISRAKEGGRDEI